LLILSYGNIFCKEKLFLALESLSSYTLLMLNPDGKLTIDLGAVRENYRTLCARVGSGVRVAAVVKANAFGLGMVEVAGALVEEGCLDFFVAKPDEATQLRKAYDAPNIYVLNGFYEGYAEAYMAQRLIPVLASFIEIEDYTALGETEGRKLPAFLKFNTRMNRLGFGSVEQEELWRDLSRLDGIEVRGVMSHMACGDEPNHPLNEKQCGLFEEIAGHFPEAVKSLCNSPSVFADAKYNFDMVRVGAALYGLNPHGAVDQENPMRPVVSLSVPVIRTRHVFAGAKVGYGASYEFEEGTQLATVAAGYADGILRSLSNEGALYWKGYRCPIRGRVSMDLTTVDLGGVPEGERPKPGDMMEVLGAHQSADDMAADAGTIGYEVLTSLGARYKRVYV